MRPFLDRKSADVARKAAQTQRKKKEEEGKEYALIISFGEVGGRPGSGIMARGNARDTARKYVWKTSDRSDTLVYVTL